MNPESQRPEDDKQIASEPRPSEAEEYQDEHSDDENNEELLRELEDFDKLIDQHLPGAGEEVARGEVIEVPVVAVRDDSVLVDVGGKAEGVIRIEEFMRGGPKPEVEVGQIIKAVQVGKTHDGALRLSHAEARRREAEGGIREALEAQQPIKGRITRVVKGGVMVDIGLDAFMPASQVDLFKVPDLNSMVGKEIEAYVLEFDPRRKRAVLSRRRLLFERRENARQQMLDSLQAGQVLKGKVKNSLEFGVFVELGQIDGFVPREEVSWDRGTHPVEILKKGDEIEVKVLKVDHEAKKITLSRKRMTEDPWDRIDEKFPVGGKATGKIIAIQNYGAFVHLEEGITGMIHASDLSWTTGNRKPSEFVSIGDEVTAVVLELDKDKKRMSLGLKQIEGDPWEGVDQKYPKGTKVKGTITSLTSYGAFLRLDEFIEGMIHVSDLSWEKRIQHPSEVLKKGDEVEAVVLKVDPKDRRISLGIKQLADSPFDAYLSGNPVGSVVTGKVTRFAPFGVFVELAPSVEGLIHISQIADKRVELPEHVLSIDEEVTVKIVNAEPKKRKIGLSRRDALKQAERDNIKAYLKKSNDEGGSGISSLGDALKQAMDARKDKSE